MDQRPDDAALALVSVELHRARQVYPRPYASPHEAIGVLIEELDELKEEAFRRAPDLARLREEAAQVAATAARIITDLCGGTPAPDGPRCIRDRIRKHLDAHPGLIFTTATLAPVLGVNNENSLRTALGQLANDGDIARGERRGSYRSKLGGRP